MGSKQPQAELDHEPEAGPAPAPQSQRPPTPAAAALRLQASAGNRAATATLSRQPSATPAARTAAPAPTVAAGTPELKAACQQLYTALNIGGLSGAKKEQILRTLAANRSQGKALAAAYAAAYRGRSLDADLRKMSAADYVRARDYLWFGGLRTLTRILIAIAGVGTDSTALFGLLRQLAKEAPMAQLSKAWLELVGDPHNPLAARFKGLPLERAILEELSGVDVVRAKALLRTAGTKGAGELRPVDKIFIAMDQTGTDTALLFEGLSAAGPTIEQEFATYPFRDRTAWLQTKTDLIDALDSELDGEHYTRALALLGYEQDARKGAFVSGRAGVKRSGRGRLVNTVRAAVQGIGTNTELIWPAVGSASQKERDELKAILLDRSSVVRYEILSDLDDAERARLDALLGIPQTAKAPGATTGGRRPQRLNLDDPVVVRLRKLGGVDADSVFRAIKLSDRAAHAAFRAAWADAASPFRAYVATHTSADERSDLATILSTDLVRRIRWCIDTLTDDEEYLFHLLEVHASDAQRRTISATPPLMALLRSSLSTSEYRRVLAALDPKQPTPVEAARAIERRIAEETGGIYDLVGSTAGNVRDANRELQVDAAAAARDGKLADPGVQAALAVKADAASAALTDYTSARDSFVAGAEMAVNLAVGTLVTALTAGAAGPAVATQLARVALTMAAARVVTQKALKGDAFDLTSAEAVRAAVDGAVEGLMNAHGALAARGVVVEIAAARAAAGTATRSSYARILRPAIDQALGGAKDAAIGSLVSAATDDRTWSQGLAEAGERMAKSAVREATVGVGVALGLGAAGKASTAVGARLPGRRPGLDLDADPSPSAAAATPVRTPTEWLAMEQALGEAASRVPIVPNPRLSGSTVHVRYGDEGGVRLEVGPDASAVHVTQHAATVTLLLRYEGPIGQLRRLYEYVRGLLRRMPPYGSAGFEARAEIDKLQAILRELDEMKATMHARVSDAGAAPDGLASLEAEMEHLRTQLAGHQANVDSYAAGRGFIAAEGASPLPTRAKATTHRAQERRDDKGKLLGWTGLPRQLQPGMVVEFPNGARVWKNELSGDVVIESPLGPSTGERSGATATARRRGERRPDSATDAVIWEYAHAQGPMTGGEVPYAIHKAAFDFNRKVQEHGVEAYLARVQEALPPGARAIVTTHNAPPGHGVYLSRIVYWLELLIPDRQGRMQRTRAMNVELTQNVDLSGPDRTHILATVRLELPSKGDTDLMAFLQSIEDRDVHSLMTTTGPIDLAKRIKEAAPPGLYVQFEPSESWTP